MENKKVLAILGGPHPHGLTAAMLDRAVCAAERAGCEVTRINLYEKTIGFCMGCAACQRTGVCVRQDDIQEIAARIKESGTVILAAPVFWANVPAAVKNLFDRLWGTAMGETGTFPEPRLSGKRYLLLTACNTPAPFSWLFNQSRGAVSRMEEFFKTAGMKPMEKFVCAGAGGRKALPERLARRIERCWR